MRRIQLFSLVLFLQSLVTFGSHLIGGELYYTKLSNDLYLVEFKAYRDCYNGIPPFDDPLIITVYDNTDFLLGYLLIPFESSVVLPLEPVTRCAGVPDNVCVEETVYSRIFRLPPINGGYKMVYQRCCRNETIVNITEPRFAGTTYFSVIKGIESPYFNNSTPRFKNFPPIFLCKDSPLNFDHSASDPDGDSLSYELVSPWLGGDTTLTGSRPLPAARPPFQEVNWRAPYNVQNSMGGVDPVKIDSKTGLLTGTPPNIGQYVLGVAVSEYRNGVLISRTIRDFQFNVVDCPPPPTAILPDFINNCGNLTLFANNSIRATNFLWDFGDPSTTNDFSTDRFPVYNYPSPGEYKVTLIVSDNRPECADTTTSKVTIIKNPKGADFETNPICLDKFLVVKDKSNLDVGNPVSWIWMVEGRSIADETGNFTYKFSSAGQKSITMIVFNQNGCSDTISKDVPIYPLPVVSLKKNDTICLGSDKKIVASTNVNQFFWNAAQELSCTTCLDPLVTPKAMGQKSLVFNAISTYQCEQKDTITIFTPYLSANAGSDTILCNNENTQLKGSGGVLYEWSPAEFVECSQCQSTGTKLQATQQFVLKIYDKFNCTDLDTVTVTILPPVQYSITPDTAICEGEKMKLKATGGALYSWSPTSLLECGNCQSAQTKPLENTTKFNLSLTDQLGCMVKDSLVVKVYKNTLRVSPDTVVCYGASALLRAQGAIKYDWTPSLHLTCSTCPVTFASPPVSEVYTVKSVDLNGCQFEKKVSVGIRRIIPTARIENDFSRCFGSPIQFKAIVENYDRVCLGNVKLEWDFGDGVGKDTLAETSYIYNKEGVYEVKLNVKGAEDAFRKIINVYEPDSCLKNIYIPNTFTPNRDGLNDILYVRGINVVDVLFKVYNNWGEEVFSTSNMNSGWDGTYKGQEMKSQTFVYTCEATFYDGEKVFKEGNVTLLR